MNRTERNDSRIFQRLLIFNLIAVLVISLVPLFVFFQYFLKTYNEEVQSLNMQTVRQFQNEIDEQVVKVAVNFPNLYLSELDSNDALVYPLTHDISRDASAILKVVRHIGDIKNNTPYIHSIDLYYPQGNLLFMGERVCMLNESACDLGGREAWFDSFQQSDVNIGWIPARAAGRYDPGLIASYVRSIPFFGAKEARQGIIAVNIDLAELNNRLSALKPHAEGALLVVDKVGDVIAHNYGSMPVPDLLALPSISKLMNADGTGRFDANIDGQESVVSFSASRYNDWRYVSIASVDSVYLKTNRLKVWMLAVGGAFLAANVLISVWLTMRAHKPISSQMQTLKLSLARHMPIVRHNYMVGLLFGSAQSAGRGGDIGSILGIGHEGRRIASFALRVKRQPNADPQEAMAGDFHMIEQLEQAGGVADVRAIRDEQAQILGFISFPESMPDAEVATRMRSWLNETNESYLLCLGGCYPSDDVAIARSFAEADEALDYAFLYPHAEVLRYDELRLGDLKEPVGQPRALEELPASIRAGDLKRTQQLLGELFADIRGGEFTIRYCRNLMLDIVLYVDKTMQQLGFSAAEMAGGDLRELYQGVVDADRFEGWMTRLSETLVAAVNDRKQHFDHEFAEKIVSFVKGSISHQLSLAFVAEHVGVSPTYLSKIFKSITGSNFNEYVTELRLERAEALLRDKKLSVQEISYRVGYQSTHHFIRLFKEKHAMTPKQYQKALIGDDSAADEEEQP
ncbi:AraC family transcriptional regulator [Cohnella hashimotonis]|uniref:AraC family transcriptional regulator n=1 Tax=Cohnella hashimotonis TaxID=2826895 RepID=A0ABT6TF03_9BACL|nr:AraC family transcriptional regulator [Cohnella hashimotonis]MDI4645136.1 AraC family transcriptional regulator [Cohnella hashimotonis]